MTDHSPLSAEYSTEDALRLITAWKACCNEEEGWTDCPLRPCPGCEMRLLPALNVLTSEVERLRAVVEAAKAANDLLNDLIDQYADSVGHDSHTESATSAWLRLDGALRAAFSTNEEGSNASND